MKREKTKVTEEQVHQAIQRFLERGGLIKRLPPEVIPTSLMVGARHGRFEPLSYYAQTEALFV